MSLDYHSRASNGMGCRVPEDGIGEQQGPILETGE